MIDVRVRQQDRLHVDVQIANGAKQLVDLVAGIDDDGLARPLAADDEAVLVERRDRADFENHCGLQSYSTMIVCVVDDLIFSIKISTAAKALGVEMFFERSKDKVAADGRGRNSRRS